MAKTLAQGRKPGSGRKPGKGKTLSEGRKPGSGRKKGSLSKTLADGRKVGSGRKKGSVKKVDGATNKGKNNNITANNSSNTTNDNNNNNNSVNPPTVQIFPNLPSLPSLISKEAILKNGNPEAILLQAAAHNQYHSLDGLPYTQAQTYNLTQETGDSSNHNVVQQRLTAGEEANQYAVQAMENDQSNATVQVRYSDLQRLIQQNNKYENERYILSLEPTDHQNGQQNTGYEQPPPKARS